MNIIIGFLSGLCASMGLGGGFILLLYLSFFTETNAVTSAGVNLIFFLVTAIPALIIHFKNHLIDLKSILIPLISGAIGAIIGSIISGYIEDFLLRKALAILFVIFGVKELAKIIFNRKK